MKLLGTYQSKLAAFHYQELLTLLETAIAAGEYAGNKTFDTIAAQALQSQAQDFSLLPQSSAGQRVTDDAINTPLSLLQARFGALAAEAGDFSGRAASLIAMIEKDSVLIDQLLAATELEAWTHELPALSSADEVKWDYGMGYGRAASLTDISPTDPLTSVVYPARATTRTLLDMSSGTLGTGIAAPAAVRKIGVKSLSWAYTTSGQYEELYGKDWASLSLLEDHPLVSFTSAPSVETILPIGASSANYFQVSGQTVGGSLPIYTRILFKDRRSQNTLTVTAAPTVFGVDQGDVIYLECSYHAAVGTNGNLLVGLHFFDGVGNAINDAAGNPLFVGIQPGSPITTPTLISGTVSVPLNDQIRSATLYIAPSGTTTGSWTTDSSRVHTPMPIGGRGINSDLVDVYTDTQVYFALSDYLVSPDDTITFLDIPDGTALTLRYTEQYPAYQCSVNQNDWSPVIMLDPERIYPDDETEFPPIKVVNGAFPITDELSVPTGLTITMLQPPVEESLLKITTPGANVRYGQTGVLTVELERPAYLTGLHLAPSSTFPLTLLQLESQAFTTDTRTTLFQGEALIDRDMTLSFPRQLVRVLYLTVGQKNYSIKDHTVDPPDKLRRDTLAALQSSLPSIVRRTQRAVPKKVRGAQYDFGLEDIYGEDFAAQLPGVYVAGPFRVNDSPELIRFDAEVEGSPEFYLCFRAYDLNRQPVDLQLQGQRIHPSDCLVFPFSNTLTRSIVASVDLYLKIVFRSSQDLVQRFVCQLGLTGQPATLPVGGILVNGQLVGNGTLTVNGS